MDGKFDIPAGKQNLADCTVIARLLAKLEVLVGWLADPWYRTCYGRGRQLLGCRRSCGGTTNTHNIDTTKTQS